MKIGKRVADDIYVHISCLDEPDFHIHRARIVDAIKRVSLSSESAPNVFKLNQKTDRLSLLAYADFDSSAFPELLMSWTFGPGSSEQPSFRSYSSSLNPPILHRKELLVLPSHPARSHWEQCTKVAEDIGLFDNPITIGFRLNWQRLIEAKGYRLVGHDFHPIGNERTSGAVEEVLAPSPIQRHLTALSRSNISAPVQLLLRHKLLQPGQSFFDYGCGRGSDIEALRSHGVVADGWDPYFASDRSLSTSDVVNLGFVVNVIEDPAERVEAIRKAFAIADKVLSVGVMLYGTDTPGKPFLDGFLTSRNTFQKYFTQHEFRDYLEHVLNEEVFMVGPGVAFVFKDKLAQQRFSVERYKSTSISVRLTIASRPRVARDPIESVERRLAKKQSVSDQRFENAKPILDLVWMQCLELGRYPDVDDIAESEALKANFGTLGMALRQIADRYDQALLRAAEVTRKNDLLLFFAMQQFARRPAFRKLDPRLQRDVKAFFGDYAQAQQDGMRLLLDAADRTKIRDACVQASESGLGSLNPEKSLLIHLSLVERLPVVLRAYVACGLVIYDAVSDIQLVKIHIDSGKLTLLQYEDFDSSALPVLAKRIKVNIRKQDYDVFEYGSAQYPKQMLAWKSRYINEETSGFAEQQALDEQMEFIGLFPVPEHGHFPESLIQEMEARRIRLDGLRLIRSDTFPDLDQQCGINFTYRDFFECGETQNQTKIENLPKSADTYNAIYDLATLLLDPIVDYFGAIRLTYGFCSPELSRHIHSRVAPELDQHASHEVKRKGAAICNRLGAACDFIVEDESMRDVADWIIANLLFDRLYFYGDDRPIHLSYGPQNSRAAFKMQKSASGALIPRRY